MPSLINNTQKTKFKTVLSNHFDTFKRQIIVHKEPIKTVVSVTSAPVYGYGETSQVSNITYTPVTGVFDGMITYNLDQKTDELEEIKAQIGLGKVRIKVEQNARDFIEDGRKTERIEFDSKSFNTITFDGVQNFLGLKYYVFFLEGTQ